MLIACNTTVYKPLVIAWKQLKQLKMVSFNNAFLPGYSSSTFTVTTIRRWLSPCVISNGIRIVLPSATTSPDNRTTCGRSLRYPISPDVAGAAFSFFDEGPVGMSVSDCSGVTVTRSRSCRDSVVSASRSPSPVAAFEWQASSEERSRAAAVSATVIGMVVSGEVVKLQYRRGVVQADAICREKIT